MALRPLKASELRKIAEAADGQRGTALKVYAKVKDGDDSTVRYGVENPMTMSRPVNEDWRLLLDVMTDFENPNHAGFKMKSVTFSLPSGDELTLLGENFDAMFWSESSIEKFMLPYYLRNLTKAQFDDLYSFFMESKPPHTVYGFIHYPPTDPAGLDRDGIVKLITLTGTKTVKEYRDSL